jgi:hypothetical protein
MGTAESEGIMGYAEIHTSEGWVNVEDIPMINTVNCQLCNEPTEAWNIVANIVIKDNVVSVGTWQCNKCKAVNG